jgi:DNA-binding MarR family transcriptional regulator
MEEADHMAKQRRAPPPEYFFYLLFHVVKQRELVLGEVLAEMDLSIPKWRILSVLNRLGESSMGLVADFCAIDRTTLTRTMDQLVVAGFVRRTEHPQDRRQTLVSLTPAGEAAYGSAMATATAFNGKALQGVEPGEIEVLERLLSKVVRNVIEDEDWAECILDFDRANA